jgi:Peptidase family S41
VAIPRPFVGLAVGGMLFLAAAAPAVEPTRLKFLLEKAERFEKSYEWDKAFAVYEEILKSRRDQPDIKDRQLVVLRRFWQELRHRDLSYLKEVLSIDYGQAMQLHGVVFDTLLDGSMQKTKLTPSAVFRRGVEELDLALVDPVFLESHLAGVRPAAIQTFRSFLARKKADASLYTRGQCAKAVREIALAGQSGLQLNPTVTVMECACGSCYALDEYTAYLTPSQYRDLADVLKGSVALMSSVQATMKSNDIGYMQIGLFQETTPQEVDAAFGELTKSGMKGLILDLRGNSGGSLEAAIDTTRRFLGTGIITSIENYDPKLSTVYQSRNPDAWTVPLVLLVDGDTASAAEVLAGAMKEHGRAKLIGQPTFGKGISQVLVKLPDALGNVPTGGLRLTIARFFSPKGLPYAGTGVTPDIVLPRNDPTAMNPLEDQQFDAAIAEITRLLR